MKMTRSEITIKKIDNNKNDYYTKKNRNSLEEKKCSGEKN
jgi:hypothetical protein